jgi:hypothetical protein
MIPRFDYNGSLICPHCGTINLHHASVDVYQRREGPGESPEAHTSVTPDGTTVDRNMSRIVGERRGAVVIGFECENCPTVWELWVVQHKGETRISLQKSKAKRGGYANDL